MRRFSIFLLAIVIGFCGVYLFWLPDVSALRTSNPRSTAYLRLRERQARKEKKRFQKRMVWVPLGSISEHLQHAVLLAEDSMFYRHRGVDWDNMRHAFVRNWKMKRFAFGASTITQQLARNLYLSPSKNPLRKIKEILIARKLEKKLGKRRILELYLNIVEWGKGIFGAEAACLAYFEKHASEISPEEAAALAVVLPNPRRYDPTGQGPYVQHTVEVILERMRMAGYLPEISTAAVAGL